MTRDHERPVVGVVVPAHDEQALLGACLDSLHSAARTVASRATVRALVVLDACTDHSERVVRRRRVEVVRLAARNVGAARHTGCTALLSRGPRPDWLATTDADSTVDPAWLLDHVDAYDAGWDAVVGTVRVVDWEHHTDRTRARFRGAYRRDEDGNHPHVHGANLGIRARSYLEVDGFRPRATAEDVDLVARLDAAGHRVLRTRAHPVTTSARLRARAPDGFAAHLAGLASSPPTRVLAPRP